MLRRRWTLVHWLILAAAVSTPLAAQKKAALPEGMRKLKPHEIVASALERQSELGLSEAQVKKLEAWHGTVQNEKHTMLPTGRVKQPTDSMKTMITREEAYEKSAAILTPEQRMRWVALVPAPPARAAVRDSTADPLTHKGPPPQAAAASAQADGKPADPLMHAQPADPAPVRDTSGSGKKPDPMGHKP